jgi:hypothetical protein
LGHHRCMRELGVETVFKEVVAMIEEDRSKRAA